MTLCIVCKRPKEHDIHIWSEHRNLKHPDYHTFTAPEAMTLEEATKRVQSALKFQASVPNADPNVLMDAPTLRLILYEVERLCEMWSNAARAAKKRQDIIERQDAAIAAAEPTEKQPK